MKLKNFSQFIIEARGWGQSPWYYAKADQFFQDLSIEEGISDQIHELEKRWESLQETHWWNRGSRNFRANHFAVNVKLRNFPDPDKVRAILGQSEEDLSDERIDEMFWQFVADQRGFEEDDINEQYDWIDHTGWGGSSGGWFLIVPTESLEDQIAVIEEDLDLYVDLKNDLKKTPEDWNNAVNILNSPNYKRLKALGMAGVKEEAKQLEKLLDQVKRTITIAINYVNRIETDLAQIQQRAKDFSDEIVKWFYEDYLDNPDLI